MKYRGHRRDGNGVTGFDFVEDTAADFAKHCFDARWRDLVIVDDQGNDVGGISVDYAGQRVWWGDDRKAES